MAKVSKKLQQAIDSLVIHDVYLKASQAQCADGFDPKFANEEEDLLIQQMHTLRKTEVVKVEDGGELLRIFMVLGVRWVAAEDVEQPDIKAFIEGDFIAEYQIGAHLDQACIDEFASKNASYHVWPYWREFLSTQCERMRLPRVVLPAVQFCKSADAQD